MHVRSILLLPLQYQEICTLPSRAMEGHHIEVMASPCPFTVPGYVFKDPGKFHGAMPQDVYGYLFQDILVRYQNMLVRTQDNILVQCTMLLRESFETYPCMVPGYVLERPRIFTPWYSTWTVLYTCWYGTSIWILKHCTRILSSFSRPIAGVLS